MHSNKNKTRTFAKIVIVSSIVMLVLFVTSYFVIGEIFYSMAVSSHVSKTTNKIANNVAQNYEFPENDKSWIEPAMENGMACHVYVSNQDLKLHGVKYISEEPTDIWVLALHGYMANWTEMAGTANKFHNHNYNVIIPDLRGNGESKYKYYGLGYFDRFDVLTWIDYILTINSNAKIVLYGRSMGGATVMMTTGEELPNNVVCAIEDCGYSNVYDEFLYVARNVIKFKFANFYAALGNMATKRHTGVSLKQMDTISLLKKSTTPTLFIHGNKDSFVPFKMLDEVYNANDNIIKEKLVIDGAEHGMCSTVNPELYFYTVFNFISRFI